MIHNFEKIISRENLFEAWTEFIVGKRQKGDVKSFSLNLADNILRLHDDLVNLVYNHGGYEDFHISDPKPRHIHKASVRDRLLHHAIHRQLYPFFERKFIADSFSCRIDRGTHKALQRFTYFSRRTSRNNTRTCWILKCDIRKFFANIDHSILKEILAYHIYDKKILWLLDRVISSFFTVPCKGLPLGNLTSQLLVNVYMNEFDHYIKNTLGVARYIRYADDFIILSGDRDELETLVTRIADFLNQKLKLELHPRKVSIQTLASGVDFLGWVHFPKHRVLRTTAKRRMMKRITENPVPETLQSYLGLLNHGDAYRLRVNLLNTYHFLRR